LGLKRVNPVRSKIFEVSDPLTAGTSNGIKTASSEKALVFSARVDILKRVRSFEFIDYEQQTMNYELIRR
jgi:hypothetical protein